ncbi:hypothetical protein J0A68_12305 [Algoriphagus sp. H41]|uniref:DNA polymerase-3 subunit gamma/tau n=1 Tax=Algoriphagus oliviformis TaxID=2811231 RepID=A0ABS3C3Q4_9BACT|nr:hypothetical protein [Algoriphagus oliviformis]MBN7811737.1 hypothetical protein [Algoriphagus oliviformis]
MVDQRAKESAEAAKAVVQEEVVEAKPSASNIALTQELFDQHVFSIQEHFRKADKKMELAILDQPIRVKDGGEVVLGVMGSIQEEIAGKMKPELVGLIRQFTGADRVIITVELMEEVDNGKPKLYTNTDKLNFLREKHPALAEFQRKFGLEVDF